MSYLQITITRDGRLIIVHQGALKDILGLLGRYGVKVDAELETRCG